MNQSLYFKDVDSRDDLYAAEDRAVAYEMAHDQFVESMGREPTESELDEEFYMICDKYRE